MLNWVWWDLKLEYTFLKQPEINIRKVYSEVALRAKYSDFFYMELIDIGVEDGQRKDGQ